MTTLVAVHGVVPPYRYPQSELTAAFAALSHPDRSRRAALDRVHRNAGVRYRHLARPIEEYAAPVDARAGNEVWLRAATDLGERAVAEALTRARIAPDEVDLIVSTTVTGIAVPSIEARIAGRLGLRPDVVRTPLFGLGCVAGAAGIARLHDHLTGHPDQVAVLLSVELCSLTVQRDDDSMANVVASGLFGDGAAAVVAVGERRAAATGVDGPQVIASRSHLYPESERTMGWDVVPSGLKIVLDAGVPELVEQYLGDDVRNFLADNGSGIDDVAAWISHPGGPKVIEAVERTLGLPATALDPTRSSLAQLGNLSSASVLHVLADIQRDHRPGTGELGLVMALGPGFCSELVLLRW
ncbi:MAG: type III polyketide synthase [Williamsia herbipolensis]|nr:type III polyketide synthase [Williamsia herbipolensis]